MEAPVDVTTIDKYEEVISRLNNLNLTELETVIYKPERVGEIKRLLESIKNVGFVGLKKRHVANLGFYEPHVRWVFQDSEGRNIASEVYFIIAQDMLDYLNVVMGPEYRLFCLGSVAKKYATFPIGSELPVEANWNPSTYSFDDMSGETFEINLRHMNSSDIDLCIVYNTAFGHSVLFEARQLLESQLDHVRCALPSEIRFDGCRVGDDHEAAADNYLPTIDYIEV